MEEFLIKAAQLLLSLSILVVLHEFGHFIPARLFKTRVEKFYLFFNPWFSIFKRKIGETEWGIGWLPLGGYVKIAGMVDESMDTEQLAQPAQPWEFRAKPAWQRLIIMLGGVTVNLIVGFGIYSAVLFFWGEDQLTNKTLKHGVSASKNAQKLGFSSGDKILNVDGKPLDDLMDINRYFLLRDIKTVQVQSADGSKKTINIPENFGSTMWQSDDLIPILPRTYAVIGVVSEKGNAQKKGLKAGDSIVKVNNKPIQFFDEFFSIVSNKITDTVLLEIVRSGKSMSFIVPKDSLGKVGIGPNIVPGASFGFTHKSYGFGESVVGGFSSAYWILHDYAVQFKYVFTKKGASSVGGFGSMGKIFPSTWDWRIFWLNTALISIILAFMNILPIPALDGGHVVFLLYEIITGREAPQKVLEYAQYVGFFLLIGLMLYANGNDIYRWITGG